jgi:DNA replication protein DnaD
MFNRLLQTESQNYARRAGVEMVPTETSKNVGTMQKCDFSASAAKERENILHTYFSMYDSYETMVQQRKFSAQRKVAPRREDHEKKKNRRDEKIETTKRRNLRTTIRIASTS